MNAREQALARRQQPFPRNLTPAEETTVRTLIELHEPKLVAHRQGVAVSTVRTQLLRACIKAGGTTTLGLVVAYLQATKEQQ